jgi:hypothetical protein
MICNSCLEQGHWWGDWDDLDLVEDAGLIVELESLVGVYAWCDLRRVFQPGVPCECGCHMEEK